MRAPLSPIRAGHLQAKDVPPGPFPPGGRQPGPQIQPPFAGRIRRLRLQPRNFIRQQGIELGPRRVYHLFHLAPIAPVQSSADIVDVGFAAEIDDGWMRAQIAHVDDVVGAQQGVPQEADVLDAPVDKTYFLGGRQG